MTFAEHPGWSALWIGVCGAAVALLYVGLKLKGRTMKVDELPAPESGGGPACH
jgi:hypothetical protein